MKTRHTLFLTAAALALLMPLAACTMNNTAPRKPIDLSFTQMTPLQLNVGAVQLVNQAQPTGNPRVAPAMALQNYVHRRLQAVGGEGTLNFIIQQAMLTSVESTNTGGKLVEAFQLSKPMEYTITMRVGLELTGRTSQPNVKSAFTLERKKTLSEGVSLAERDRQLNELVEVMVHDVDKAVERSLADNMKLIVRPGAITFGTPAPLDSVGTVVVQPGPVSAKPVTITGTMD